jgi:ectoine hydroxylase-related dioxygenase (phytanoyl-CoA dioxygenase family)
MTFHFSDALVEEYERDGYVVFREILPPSLIADLRRATDRGRELVRKKGGSQVQRFEPFAEGEIDHQPFEEYRTLPVLRDAVSRLLSARHLYGDPNTYLAVLIEPEELPYCIAWHQDWRHFHPLSRPALTTEAKRDPDLFNQVNCALYRDDCTWVVPGSHARDDSPAEREAFPEDIPPGPPLHGTTEERERMCLDYCRRMPGAIRLHLEPGDWFIYRNTMWHTGNYVPYAKRATILDVVDTPRYREWRDKYGFSDSR